VKDFKGLEEFLAEKAMFARWSELFYQCVIIEDFQTWKQGEQKNG
jgi:hypothetical protein